MRRGVTSESEALGQAQAAVLTPADGLPVFTALTVSEELCDLKSFSPTVA